MSNAKFEQIKAKHPNWSDEQIWTAVSLDMESDKVIEEKGQDIDSNDPNIFASIVEGAKQWLHEVLPVIFEKVKDFFNDLLAQVKAWIGKKLPEIMERIREYVVVYFNKGPLYYK